VTPENTKLNDPPQEPAEQPAPAQPEVRNLDVWARSAPIRLAGYEDDPAETHILRGID
jgi:hypothetical protein